MKTVVFCVSANKFSKTLAEHFSKKIETSSISYDGGKTYRLIKLIIMILASWAYRIHPNYRVSLMIPHTFGSFGKIKKLLYFDEISIFEDGISLFSNNSFQQKYIFPIFSSKKFKNLFTCDRDIIPLPAINENIKYTCRKNIVCRLIEESQKPIELTEKKVILIDNGVWDEKELEFLKDKVQKSSGEKPLILKHPSRKGDQLNLTFGKKIPAEVFLVYNDNKIKAIYGNFSTAIINYSAIAGYSKVNFIVKHCGTHLDRISRTGGKLV